MIKNLVSDRTPHDVLKFTIQDRNIAILFPSAIDIEINVT